MMPEPDDKLESAAGDKPGDRRFWRALAGDKRTDDEGGAKDKSPAATGTESRHLQSPPATDAVTGSDTSSDSSSDSSSVKGSVKGSATSSDTGPDAGAVAESTGDPEPDAVDLTPGDEQRLNPAERAARREALRNMLHRSVARHNNVRRKRRPVLTAGTQVRVASGPHVGEEGVILDADYIESRVLLALGGKQTPTWVSFEQVAGPRRKN